jgi:hypothetical protein
MVFIESSVRNLPRLSSSIALLSKVDVSGNRPRSFSRVFSRSRSYESSITFDINEYNRRASSQVNYSSFYSYFGAYKLRRFSRHLPLSFGKPIYSQFVDYMHYIHRIKRIKNGFLLISRSFGRMGSTAIFYSKDAPDFGRRKRFSPISSRWKRSKKLVKFLKFSTWFPFLLNSAVFSKSESRGFFFKQLKRRANKRKLIRFFVPSAFSSFRNVFFYNSKYLYTDNMSFSARRSSYTGKRGNTFLKVLHLL